jgi:glucans biosynthesis protein
MSEKRICGAKTRQGQPCQRRPMKNGRCHFHGGKSPGAKRGNKYALKHGHYTREAIEQRRAIRQMLRTAKALDALVER